MSKYSFIRSTRFAACFTLLTFTLQNVASADILQGESYAPHTGPEKGLAETQGQFLRDGVLRAEDRVQTSLGFLEGASALSHPESASDVAKTQPGAVRASEEAVISRFANMTQDKLVTAEYGDSGLEVAAIASGRLENAQFDPQGMFLSGRVTDASGSYLDYENGRLKRRITSESSEIFDDSGYVIQRILKDGSTRSYARKIDAQGRTAEITRIEGPLDSVPPPVRLEEITSPQADHYELGSNQHVSAFFQSMTPAESQKIQSLEFKLAKWGKPSGNLRAVIYADDRGKPGSILALSAERSASEFESHSAYPQLSNLPWQKFNFPDEFEMNAKTTYWLSLETAPGYASMGDGAHMFRVYSTKGSDAYPGGVLVSRSRQGTRSLSGLDLMMRLNGRLSRSGPSKVRFVPGAQGEFKPASGTSALPEEFQNEGYVIPRKDPAFLKELTRAYLSAKTSAPRIVSAASTAARQIDLRFVIGGVEFSEHFDLQPGVNNLEKSYESHGRRITIRASVYSDTFPPVVRQESGGITHSGKTQLAYFVDGVLGTETVYPAVGRNVFRREFSNAWGTSVTEFALDYQPRLDDGTILRYRNGQLTSALKDGVLYDNLRFDADAGLLSASIRTSRGDRLEIEQGQIREIQSPDGRIRRFDHEFLNEDWRPGQVPVFFKRHLNTSGTAAELTITEGREEDRPSPERIAEQDTAGASPVEIGSNIGVREALQSIRFQSDTALQQADFLLSKYKFPAGSLKVKLYESSASGTQGKLLAESAPVDAASLPSKTATAITNASWQPFRFAEPILLKGGQTYWVSLSLGDDYKNFGDGGNFITAYLQDKGDPYTGGQAALIRKGAFVAAPKDFQFRLHGYSGGIPFPRTSRFSVSKDGQLTFMKGESRAASHAAQPEGYTVPISRETLAEREGADLAALLVHARQYLFPPEVPSARLISPSVTKDTPYRLVFSAEGKTYEQVQTLHEGENKLQVEFAGALGQTRVFDFWVTLDTLPPALVLVSPPVTNKSSYLLRYSADGELREENVNLTEGINSLTREARDSAGNLSQIAFQITMDPAYEAFQTEDRADGSLERVRLDNGTLIRYESDGRLMIEKGAGASAAEETLGTPGLRSWPPEELVDVTMADGSRIYYRSNRPVEYLTHEGVRVQNYEKNSLGEWHRADLLYPDGSFEFVREGFRIRSVSPAGIITDYLPNELPARSFGESGTEHFRYARDPRKEGFTVRIFRSERDYVLYDDAGVLREIRTQDEVLRYSRMREGEGWKLMLNRGESSPPKPTDWVEALLTDEGKPASVRLEDGTRVDYKDGYPILALSPAGVETRYDFEKLTDLNRSMTVQRDGKRLVYDSGGFLRRIETSVGTLTRSAQDTDQDGSLLDEADIQLILEESGGNKVRDFTLDHEGRLVQGILETPGGLQQYIEKGSLKGFKTSEGKLYTLQESESSKQAHLQEWSFDDGTTAFYEEGRLRELLLPGGTRVSGLGSGPDGALQEAVIREKDGTVRRFAGGRILSAEFPDGSRIDYDASEGGARFKQPDGSIQQVAWIPSADQAARIRMTDGKTQRIYDEAGRLLETQTEGLRILYRDGRIQKLMTPFGEIHNPDVSGGRISGEAVYADGAKQTLERGEVIRTVTARGSVIDYEKGRIRRVQTKRTQYEITYRDHTERTEALSGAWIKSLEQPGLSPEPLVVFLLKSADEDLKEILLARDLVDLSSRPDRLSLDLREGGDLSHRVSIAERHFDAERGQVFRLSKTYQAGWRSDKASETPALSRFERGVEWDDLPSQTRGFFDMDGDGLLDQVTVLPDSRGWIWQKNTGADFAAAQVWPGADLQFPVAGKASSSIRFYEGRHPHRLGDLTDINGDGRPDRVLQKPQGTSEWFVQLNNGAGFDPVRLWDSGIQPASQNSSQAEYASWVRDDHRHVSEQPLLADLIDLDGDGLKDRVVRPLSPPYNVWLFQRNNSQGFDDSVVWRGVDDSFAPAAAVAGSLGWSDQVQNSAMPPSAAILESRLQSMTEEKNSTRCANLLGAQKNGCENERLKTLTALAGEITRAFGTAGAEGYRDLLMQPDKAFYTIQDFERFSQAVREGIRMLSQGEVERARLMDLDGDGKPDRILIRPVKASEPQGRQAWWWQRNSGQGFEPAALWHEEVRAMPGAPSLMAATSLSWTPQTFHPRQTLSELIDVTGDGRPDRVTVDAVKTWGEAQSIWWVERNLGAGFGKAEPWSGIEGRDDLESAIAQTPDNFRGLPLGSQAATFEVRTELKDLNGDHRPDRIYYDAATKTRRIQLNTGHGFLPSRPLEIESLNFSTREVSGSTYGLLHISLKRGASASGGDSALRISMGDPSEGENTQEWRIDSLTETWQDFYLPLGPGEVPPGGLSLSFPGTSAARPDVFASNAALVTLRRPDALEWIGRLGVSSGSLQLGLQDQAEVPPALLASGDPGRQNLPLGQKLYEELLGAETLYQFGEAGDLEFFQTASGSLSRLRDGKITETLLADGSVLTTRQSSSDTSESFLRVFHDASGVKLEQEIAFGKIRQVQREGQAPLRYAYEYDAQGRELVAVTDPESGTIEKYRRIAGQSKVVSRTQAQGVTTLYEYDAQGNLKESVFFYKGRRRDAYAFSQTAAGLIQVKTEEGLTEEYDQDGRLRFHTTADGYRYEHSQVLGRTLKSTMRQEIVLNEEGKETRIDVPELVYEDCTADCSEVNRVSLTGYRDSQVQAQYQEGLLHTLTLQDGRTLRFSKTLRITDSMQAASEGPRESLDLRDVRMTYPDGTEIEYRGKKPWGLRTSGSPQFQFFAELDRGRASGEALQFHHDLAERLWDEVVVPSWQKYEAGTDLEVETDYDAAGKVMTRRYGGGISEIYDEGRIAMTLSASGERLTRYEYDAEGNPVHVELEASRRGLSLALARLRAETALQRAKAAVFLADREEAVRRTLEGQYLSRRDRLLAVRVKLEDQRNLLGSFAAKGRAVKIALSDASHQLHSALLKVEGYLERLALDQIKALGALSGEAGAASADLDAQTSSAYAKITAEEASLKKAILRHEIQPVISHWYRKILGRGASRTEIEQILESADAAGGKFDLESLILKLRSGEELRLRNVEVDSIREAVSRDLRDYAAMSREAKRDFARALGLDPESLISLSETEAETLLKWLNSRSLHFGQSAYLALESLLSAAGLDHERRELARKLILIDILTGTLTALENGDLVLSMFALKQAAALYGLETQGAELNYEGLRTLYLAQCPQDASSCAFRVAAHLDGNHYVVLTRIGEGEVTYLETGSAASAEMEGITMKRSEFEAAWLDPRAPHRGKGRILTSLDMPVSELTASRAQMMSSGELMGVRGAFFELIAIAVIAASKAVIAAVAGAVASITAIVQSMTAAASAVMQGMGSLISGVFTGQMITGVQGLLNSMLSGLGQAAAGVYKGVMAFGETAGRIWAAGGLNAGGLQASSAAFLKSSALSSLLKGTLAGQAVSGAFLGAGKLLEWAGVSPKLSQGIMAGSKMLSGSILMGSGHALGANLIGRGASDLLSLNAALSPALSGLIGAGVSAVSAITLGIGNLNGVDALKSAAPDLSMELAASGLYALGDGIEMDPRWLALGSVPVRSAVGYAVGNTLAPARYRGALNQIRTDTFKGITGVGVSLGAESLGVSPGASGALSDMLSASVSAFSRVPSLGEKFDEAPSKTSLGRFINVLAEGTGRFLTGLGNAGRSLASQAKAVLEGTVQMSSDLFRKLTDSVFHWLNPKTREYFYQEEAGLRQGEIREQGDVWIWRSDSETLSWNRRTGEWLNESQGRESLRLEGWTENRSGGIDYGQMTRREYIGDGWTRTQRFSKGTFQNAELDYHGVTMAGIRGADSRGILLDAQGGIFSGDLRLFQPQTLRASPDAAISTSSSASSRIPGALEFSIRRGQTVSGRFESGQAPVRMMPGGEVFVLANGILSPETEGPPAYLNTLGKDLLAASDTAGIQSEVILADTYHKMKVLALASDLGAGSLAYRMIGGFALSASSLTGGALLGALAETLLSLTKDLSVWAAEVSDPVSHGGPARDIERDLRAYWDKATPEERARGMVAVGYSGGFMPLVEVLNEAPRTLGDPEGYRVKSVAALGAASLASDDVTLKIFEAGRKILSGEATFSFLDSLTRDYFGGGLRLDRLDAEKIMRFISGRSPEDAYSVYRRFIESSTLAQPAAKPASLVSTGAQMLVNVYGTRDILGALKINGTALGGYREELLGYAIDDRARPLINIEIQGASHTDYVRGPDAGRQWAGFVGQASGWVQGHDPWGRKTWNDTVSSFTADLLAHAGSQETLVTFLTSPETLIEHSVEIEQNSGKWIVRFPNWEGRDQ